MRTLLTKTDAWPYVSGPLVKPGVVVADATNTLSFQAWTLADQKVYSDIILSICPSEIKGIVLHQESYG